MAGKLADAFIEIRADMKRFFADMRSARSGVQNALQGIATTAGGIAAAMGINKISEAMQSLVKTMFTANAEIESFAVNFEVFLGSAEKGAAFLSEFRRKFQEFPFPMQDLIGAGGQLLAIGKRGKEVLDIVEAIANATAASGSGRDVFHRISVNMAQMIAQGRIMSADMRQFELALVPAWKILSDEMGVSIAKLREMSKEGKLGQSAVDALVRGLMKMSDVVGARSKTAFGMIDILRKRWLLFMEEAGKPLFDGVKAGLQRLIELTDSKQFKEFTMLMKEIATNVAALFKSIPAEGAFSAILSGLKEVLDFASLISTDWQKTWQIIKASGALAIIEVADRVRWLFKDVVPTFAAAAADAIFAGFKAAAENIRTVFEGLATFFKNAFEAAIDAIGVRIEGFARVFEKIKQGDILGAIKEHFASGGKADMTFGKGLAKASGEFARSIAPVAGKSIADAMEAFRKAMATMPGFEGSEEGKALAEEIARLFRELERERERRRAEKPPEAAPGDEGEEKPKETPEFGKAIFTGLPELSRRIQLSLTSKSPEIERLDRIAKAGEAAAAHAKLTLETERAILGVVKKDRVVKAM